MAGISLAVGLIVDDDESAVRVDKQPPDPSQPTNQQADLQQDGAGLQRLEEDVASLQRAIRRELGQAATSELTGFDDPPKPDHLEGANGIKGTLVAIPQEPTAGSELAVAVINTGRKQMAFGLGFRVERRSGGRWHDVTRAAIGSGAVRSIGLYAQPGKSTGPRYGGSLRDAFALSAGLEPGRYRAIKPVARSLGAYDEHAVPLDAEFSVVAPGD